MTKHRSTFRSKSHARSLGVAVGGPLAVAAIAAVVAAAGSPAQAVDSPQLSDKKPKSGHHGRHVNTSSSPASDNTLQDTTDMYTVVDGDTVRDIAQRAGVSTAELLAANGLSWRTMIAVGQVLHVPLNTAGIPARFETVDISRHNVVAGDTLEAIARLYGVQPRAIMTANGLHKTSRLIIGQRLVIPSMSMMETLPAV